MTTKQPLNDNSDEIIDENVKIFRISDLISSAYIPEQVVEETGRKTRRCRNSPQNVLVEASSFKQSNKLAVHGNKQKKAKVVPNNNSDVLWQHNCKLKYFEELQESLQQKRKELEKCKLPAKRRLLEKEIESITNREEEMDYHLLTHNVINEYTQMLQSNNLENMKKDNSGQITKFIGKYDNVAKEKLTEEYCRIMNNGMMIDTKKLSFDTSECLKCSAINTISDVSEGFTICMDCGHVVENSVPLFQASYKDICDTTYKSPFSYKRINRFNEILATLQAKENTDIPQFVMNAVQKEIDKEQKYDIDNIDNVKIRYYLKRLSLTNFYEHSPHILNQINKIRPIQIPIEVEEMLREMFKQIQDPFEKVKEKVCPSRLSFLSYNFVLYKFCELLDLEEFQKCFTLLKSIDKLRLQDKIWKGICEELGWEYIPSI